MKWQYVCLMVAAVIIVLSVLIVIGAYVADGDWLVACVVVFLPLLMAGGSVYWSVSCLLEEGESSGLLDDKIELTYDDIDINEGDVL